MPQQKRTYNGYNRKYQSYIHACVYGCVYTILIVFLIRTLRTTSLHIRSMSTLHVSSCYWFIDNNYWSQVSPLRPWDFLGFRDFNGRRGIREKVVEKMYASVVLRRARV